MEKLPKGFLKCFERKPGSENDQKQDIKTHIKGKTYRQYGWEECKNHGASELSLDICLSHIHAIFHKGYIEDKETQEELKKGYSIKLEVIKTDNRNLQTQIDVIKTEKIPSAKEKIDTSEEKIRSIKENPQQLGYERPSKVGFIIGAAITLFLTLYLFLFYSSATFSTFFKQFTRNDIGIVSSIFDPQAIQKAYHEGVWELALIILAPFIFLALGFLIHKFFEQEKTKVWGKIWGFVKVAFLLIVTLFFDCIIAFKITKEIYKLEETLKSPPFDLGIALHDINFWIIIFAGFVVYVVWGLIFNFVMDEYKKLNIVQIAIENEQEKINKLNEEIKKLNNEIDQKTTQQQNNEKTMAELMEILKGGIIVYKEYESSHLEFMTGWMACIEENKFGEEKKEIAENVSKRKLIEMKRSFKKL